MEAKSLVPKLRFRGFKEYWEENKLGDIATFYNSKRVALTASDREKGEYPYYGASGIIDYVKDFIFEGEYILLGEDGANIVMRNSRLVFLAKGKFWLNNHAHIFQSKDSNAFLCEALERINYTKYNTGTAQPKLNSDVVKKIKLKLPSLPEQQKIASFLTSVDNKINLLTKKKALLETYKKGVMQKIFSQEIGFKDEEGNDYPNWEEKRLLDFCKFFSGGTPTSTNMEYYTGKIPFIGSGNIYDTEVFSFISEEALASSSAKLVKKGDLLYALYGANSGESAISKLEGAINQAILCIRSKESDDFLNYLLVLNKDKIVVKYLQGGQGNLSAQIIKKLKYKIPSIVEQNKIASFLSSIDKKIELVDFQLERNKEFKKGLLQQMFV